MSKYFTMPVTFQTPQKRQKNCIRNDPLTVHCEYDSFIIGIDYYDDRCISKDKEHFISFTPTSNMSKSPSFKHLKGGLIYIGSRYSEIVVGDDLARGTYHDIMNTLSLNIGHNSHHAIT